MNTARKKLIRKLAGWTWSWVATLAVATFGPKFIWDDHSFLTIFAILVNLANGILMIIANRNLFNHFDELEKKIHLESMSLTLGLAIIFGMFYSLLDVSNLVTHNAEIGILIGFIGISYIITLIINTRRYQ